MTTIVIIALAALNLILLAFLFAKVISLSRGENVAQTLTGAMADVAERIARSGADLRQELSDRVGDQFKQVREHLDNQLAQNRQEQQTGLVRTTEALEKKFQTLEEKTEQRLDSIRSKIDERLSTIGKDVQGKLDENMKESFKHFEKFQQYMKDAEAQLKNVGTVGESINDLNNLLKLPHLRGTEFGEMTLEMLLSDFLPPEMFELQFEFPADVEGKKCKVDALIKFPEAGLPIDSKFPREQVASLFESEDKDKIAEARKTLRKIIAEQARYIAAKYIRPECGTTDMALMFLPSETLYFEVIRNTELWNDLSKKRVYPVSPNTLAITLKSVYLAYKNYKTAAGVKKTVESLELAKKHLNNFEKQFGDVGDKLQKAQNAYQVATTHFGYYQRAITKIAGAEQEELDEYAVKNSDEET